MSIDFTKQNNLQEKLILVRALYERFNLNYGNLIDMNLVDKAISGATEIKRNVSNKYENLPEEIRSLFANEFIGLNYGDKIYFFDDCFVDVIFHEILHSICFQHKGVCRLFVASCTDEELCSLVAKYGIDRLVSQLDQLDESMTRFITELAIPEIEISGDYGYGANIIKRYYEELVSNNIDPTFILNIYINGEMSDFMKFRNSFGEKFVEVLDMIQRRNRIGFEVYEPEISKADMAKIISDAAMQVKNKSNYSTYHKI